MLKVLYLPLNAPGGVQQGTYDAWNNVGVNLEIFDFYSIFTANKQSYSHVRFKFLEKIREFRPDLIHMQMQFNDVIDAATLSQARAINENVVITNWTGDIRAGANKNFINLSKALDRSLISSTGQLDLYRKSGCHNVDYWQIGFDPKMSFPKNYTSFKYDVSFLANNYGSTFPDGDIRYNAAVRCYDTFGARFGLHGSGYPTKMKSKFIDPRDANEVYNQSICALSISNFNSVSHYFSDRLLYCMASGRPTITWYFPGAESYFADGKEAFFAKSYDDIINIVNYCKNNPDIANKVGADGHKRVLKEHTYTSRVIELLNITNLIHKV